MSANFKTTGPPKSLPQVSLLPSSTVSSTFLSTLWQSQPAAGDSCTQGLAGLLRALRGSGSFNLLCVQGEGRASFSLINKEKIQSLLN